MNVHHISAGDRSPLTHQQHAAIAVAAALETALTSTRLASGGGPVLSFTFAGEPQLRAACDAWRTYALSTIDTPASVVATAVQRLTAQIGLALFNDATIDLMQIANRLEVLQVAAGAPLLPPVSGS